MSDSILWSIIIMVPPLLVAVILHEIAHGLAAEKLGDPTARDLGRITLNPLRHIDPFLTVILPGILILANTGIIFGGAKPVPVNPMNFKDPRRGMLWVALAGPVVNFILAGLSYGAVYLLSGISIAGTTELERFFLTLCVAWCTYSVLINIVLGLFNLLPVPPLDGGRIVVGILPEKLAFRYARMERWGFIIVVVLIYAGLPQLVLGPVIEFAAKGLP